MLYSVLVVHLRTSLLLAALAPTGAGWPTHNLHQAPAALVRLPAAERAMVSRLLRPELGPLFHGESSQVIAQTLTSFRVERVGAGAARLLVVQANGSELCSPAGNCAFWIVDLQHRSILLRAPGVQSYAIDRSAPGRLADVVTSMHGSATEASLTRWHFDGAQYQPSGCAQSESADADGKPYNEPKVTPHPCNAEGDDRGR